MVGAVADNEGEDAESRIHHRQRDDTVPGDLADSRVKVLKIVAEAAEKQEDRDVQKRVDAVHKLLTRTGYPGFLCSKDV